MPNNAAVQSAARTYQTSAPCRYISVIL